MSGIRKQIFVPKPAMPPGLDLIALASFEISSEEPSHLLERAFESGVNQWRAATDGPQTIRLTFIKPQRISRISLVFNEQTVTRTQEFAIFTTTASDGKWRQFVRQQFNFSPPDTTREREDYALAMDDVTGLELQISPGAGRASLTEFAVG
jgi:hypothetical protein